MLFCHLVFVFSIISESSPLTMSLLHFATNFSGVQMLILRPLPSTFVCIQYFVMPNVVFYCASDGARGDSMISVRGSKELIQ